MKRLFLLSAISLMVIGCQRAETAEEIQPNVSADCNKVINSNSAVNPWGVLSRYTCKAGPGEDATIINGTGSRFSNPLLVSNPNQSAKAGPTKSVHFWFYGTTTQKLFKPVSYARVFVFEDNPTDIAKIHAAKSQILAGNHYLGFDTGVFKDIYPLYVLNINHKQNPTTGNITSSYNLESEVKKSLPAGKRIFVQFIVQSSPATTVPTNFDTAKYAYCEFLNEDNNLYPHYKIDYSDSNLGYQGNSFFYN